MFPTRTFKIFLLGTPRLEVDGQPVHLERQKSTALLAYLVVTGRTHSREWLATLLWPDVSTSRTQLRKSLADLRQKLGDNWLYTAWDEVGIKEGSLWSDVGELLRVNMSFAKGETESLLDVNTILNLYPEHLLSGFTLRDAPDFDDWQRVEEQNLRARFERLVDFAVAQFIQRNQFQAALTLAHHWVTINPYNEHARRQLIRLYAWTNQRGLALREYQQLHSDIWENHRAEPEPETRDLFQQLQSGAPATLPDRQLSRLPMLSPLIGRNSELQLLIQMVNEGARLITITGPGGVGKTHLAVATAHAFENVFADGCYLVGLESGGNPRSLISALAQTLAVPSPIDRELPTAVYDFLHTKRALIVLDSVHHIDQAQQVIQTVLHNAPQIVLLLTSYHALDMNSEYCFALQGLSVNDDDLAVVQSAAQLFVQSARRVLPDFQLTPDNVADISRICQLVEGIPLGILLASAWCAVLAPREIAEEIEENYDFLQVSHRDIPERHQSLRAVFESAWQWLSADEQQALMNLSVFPENFTRKAAEQIALVRLATLKGLTSKALISFIPSKQRYALHDVSRQYAGEKLVAAGTQADIRERYQRFYAHYLIERYPALRSHLKETAWREIEIEFTHIRAAWRGVLADHNFPLILQMMEPLHLFLQSRGWEQGLLLFDEARQVAAVSDESRSIYFKLLMRFFPSAFGMERWQRELHAALEVASANDDTSEVAYLHGEFGWYCLSLGDYVEARMHFSQAEAYYRTADDRYALAAILRGIAYSDVALGEHKTAEQHTKESLRLRRAIGDHEGEHETLLLQAELALLGGEIDRAGQCFQSVYSYFRSRYPDLVALLRSHSISWFWVFNQQLEQAHAFADQVIASLTSDQAAVVVCTAHAIKLAAYGFQNSRASMQNEIEQIEDLLSDHPLWDSTSNPDMRFLIDFSLLLGYTLLDQRDGALNIMSDLAKSGRLNHPVYFTWLAPVLIVLVSNLGYSKLAQSLCIFHRESFLSSAKWAAQWTELQMKLAGSIPEISERNTVHQLANAVLSLPNYKDTLL
jgi:predicted ATPase/DNA-binding SARP family transcriptional activator